MGTDYQPLIQPLENDWPMLLLFPSQVVLYAWSVGRRQDTALCTLS